MINLISREAIFYSPIVYKPQVGRQKVNSYLSAAMEVFTNTNFKYIKKIGSFDETYAEFIYHNLALDPKHSTTPEHSNALISSAV